MTLTQYLDLAYAVVVEEHVRRGGSLFDVLESTAEFAAGSNKGVMVGTASGNGQREQKRTGSGQTVEDMNNESLAILTGAMKNVQGGFR